MSAPVSIRLDDEVRETLEAEARSRNIGLATLLRQIAAEAARHPVFALTPVDRDRGIGGRRS